MAPDQPVLYPEHRRAQPSPRDPDSTALHPKILTAQLCTPRS